MLTRKKLFEALDYESSSGLFTWRRSGSGITVGKIAGTITNGYRVIVLFGKPHRAAKLVWLAETGKYPEHEVDHKNRKRDDNRWSNLRAATRTQQMQNCGVYKNSISGIRGVRLHRTGKWEARIRVDKELIYLGVFASKKEAIAVRHEAAERYQGEFASHLNI
jgi:HNH endonuclease